MTAGAKNVNTVAAGEVIYSVGNTGIDFGKWKSVDAPFLAVVLEGFRELPGIWLTVFPVLGIIQADITPLQWRGFVSGMTSLPFVPNAFIAGYITSGISAFSENGWRWGVSPLGTVYFAPLTRVVRHVRNYGACMYCSSALDSLLGR